MTSSTTINYPNGGKADNPCHKPCALGRNGWADNSGLLVRDALTGSFIEIVPITSKGRAQRCKIWVPRDAQTIRQLSDALADIATSLEQEN